MNKNIKGILKKVTAISVAICVTAGQFVFAADDVVKYKDVSSDAWYASAVQKLGDAGVIKGKDGKFAPQDKISRAEFLTLLHGLESIDTPKVNSEIKFSDVNKADWYSSKIEWAVALGIAAGYNDGTFRPNASVTRAEAAVFVKRFMSAANKIMDKSTAKDFADAARIPAWASAAVKECVEMGIIKGYPDKTFRPSGNISRAEAAFMINSIYGGGSAAQTSGDTSFADAFAKAVEKENDGNYLISPYSAKIALAMTANGADGNTLKEMLSVLGISDINAFNGKIKSQKSAYADASPAMTLDVNNSLWLNKSKIGDLKFKDKFRKTAENFYDAKIGIVTDDDAVSAINGWISDKTKGKIKEGINSAEFSSVLVNTLYFKSAWKEIFDKGYTNKDNFTQADGKVAKIDFMNMQRNIDYYSGDGVRMISLPYDNNSYKKGQYADVVDKTFSNMNLSMYIALSDENKSVNMDELIKSATFTKVPVDVSMPKFEIKYGKSLKQILQNMGMKDAFTGKADFTGMMDVPQAIGDVIQNTYINVDEEGTEAAAATVVTMLETTFVGDKKEPIIFKADKPFRFAIYDNNSKEVLFSGRYSMAG